ncbi:FAD:protein FMN transferase [Shewanella frigidimarina]|uniref:FAD:protein FMN transferase n=1 Tax=Shewanella frigidimarina (strain NCIMB 400) TaxID=318167 RepID=Q085T5_SHEFN|nr:FAD:protein FMN transferase [Shewanella frigidimarina]ABI70980.1 ApbE family lipoprotein [Shewanella frigidimarina NCIMB 400]
MSKAPKVMSLQPRPWGFLGSFNAMASPCELLMAIDDEHTARQMLTIAYDEAKRIEHKFSRFIEGNVVWQLNHAQGKATSVDAETAHLLQFAQQCFQLSESAFDISACPLMALWRFDGNHRVPLQTDIDAALLKVGFDRIALTDKTVCMPADMSVDFGGIGKEYAVDRTAQILANRWPNQSVLVNFGGDIACPITKSDGWQVGIENPNKLDNAAALLTIRQGALATSGTTRRYIEVDGKRYGHIINPQTGYPVEQAPLSVTVLAPNCVMAGMLATMSMLKGADAEDFLQQQGVDFKVFR